MDVVDWLLSERQRCNDARRHGSSIPPSTSSSLSSGAPTTYKRCIQDAARFHFERCSREVETLVPACSTPGDTDGHYATRHAQEPGQGSQSGVDTAAAGTARLSWKHVMRVLNELHDGTGSVALAVPHFRQLPGPFSPTHTAAAALEPSAVATVTQNPYAKEVYYARTAHGHTPADPGKIPTEPPTDGSEPAFDFQGFFRVYGGADAAHARVVAAEKAAATAHVQKDRELDTSTLPQLPPPVPFEPAAANAATAEQSVRVGRVLRPFESVVVQRPGDNERRAATLAPIPRVAVPPSSPTSPAAAAASLPRLSSHTTLAGGATAAEDNAALARAALGSVGCGGEAVVVLGDNTAVPDDETAAAAVAAAAASSTSPGAKPSPKPRLLGSSLGGALTNRPRQRWLSISLRTRTLTLFRNHSRRATKATMSLASIATVRPAVGGGAKPHSFEVLQYRTSNHKSGNNKINLPSSLDVEATMRVTCLDKVTCTRWVTAIATHCLLDALSSALYNMQAHACGEPVARMSDTSASASEAEAGAVSGAVGHQGHHKDAGSPVLQTTDNGLLSRVRLLVQHGADINLAVDDGSASPALLLAMKLDYETYKVHSQMRQKLTGATDVCTEGFAVAEYLVRAGADARCLLRDGLGSVDGDDSAGSSGRSSGRHGSHDYGDMLKMMDDDSASDVTAPGLDGGDLDPPTCVWSARVALLLRRAGRSLVFSSDDGTGHSLLHRLVLEGNVNAVKFFLGPDDDAAEGESTVPSAVLGKGVAQASHTHVGGNDAGENMQRPVQMPWQRVQALELARSVDAAADTPLLLAIKGAGAAWAWAQAHRRTPLASKNMPVSAVPGSVRQVGLQQGSAIAMALMRHSNFRAVDASGVPLLLLTLRARAPRLALAMLRTVFEPWHVSNGGDGAGTSTTQAQLDLMARDENGYHVLHYALLGAANAGAYVDKSSPDSNDEAAGFFELSAWLAEREPRFAVVPPASDGRPLLTLAAQCGPDASNTCLWLLKHGAVCNGVGASFDPPLHEAIKMRLTSVVEAMLAPEHGVDLLARDANGSQPLHLAARHGLFDAAMRIAWAVVSAGSSSDGDTSSCDGIHALEDVESASGETALSLLLGKGQLELCCALLDAGIKADWSPPTSSSFGLGAAVRPEFGGWTALHRLGLLVAECNPLEGSSAHGQDRFGGTLTLALCLSAALIDRGSVNLLRTMSWQGTLEHVTDYIGHGTSQHTVLHLVAAFPETCTGANAFTKLLLRCAPDDMLLELLRARDSSGNTPLALAARSANSVSVRLLLEAGAIIGAITGDGVADYANALNAAGETPLHIAVRAALLHEAQANVSAEATRHWHGSEQGRVAPTITATRIVAVVTELLRAGAYASQWDSFGLTALHVALVMGSELDQKLVLENKEAQLQKQQEQEGEAGQQQRRKQRRDSRTASRLFNREQQDQWLDATGVALVGCFCSAGGSFGPGLLDMRSEDGLTPAHLAVQCGRSRTLEALLRAGVDTRALVPKTRQSLLHLSAEALRRAAMQIARARAECEGGGFGWDDDADEDGSNRGGNDGSGRTTITNKSGVGGSNIGDSAAEVVKAALAAGASRRSLTRLHDRQRHMRAQLRVGQVLLRESSTGHSIAVATATSTRISPNEKAGACGDDAVNALAFIHQFVAEHQNGWGDGDGASPAVFDLPPVSTPPVAPVQSHFRAPADVSVPVPVPVPMPVPHSTVVPSAVVPIVPSTAPSAAPNAAAVSASTVATATATALTLTSSSPAAEIESTVELSIERTSEGPADAVPPSSICSSSDGVNSGELRTLVLDPLPDRTQLESVSLQLALNDARAVAAEWLAKRSGQRKLAADAAQLRAKQPGLSKADATKLAREAFIEKHLHEQRLEFEAELKSNIGMNL